MLQWCKLLQDVPRAKWRRWFRRGIIFGMDLCVRLRHGAGSEVQKLELDVYVQKSELSVGVAIVQAGVNLTKRE